MEAFTGRLAVGASVTIQLFRYGAVRHGRCRVPALTVRLSRRLTLS